MLIIGLDYHPSVQQIAFVDLETGETGERQLNHNDLRNLRTWSSGGSGLSHSKCGVATRRPLKVATCTIVRYGHDSGACRKIR
jgi:hypothetical protein